MFGSGFRFRTPVEIGVLCAAAVLAASQIGCAAPEQVIRSTDCKYERIETISLVALLANPKSFNHRRVRVAGFATLEFEHSGLYLDREAEGGGLYINSIWISKPENMDKYLIKTMNRTYVYIDGVFDSDFRGHNGVYSGSFSNIHEISSVSTTAGYYFVCSGK